MSKAVRSLIIAFSVFCAFMLAVFLIQLLVLNSGDGSGAAGSPDPSGASPTGSGPSHWSPPSESPAGQGATDPSGDAASPGLDEPGSAPPEREGTVYSFDMPGDQKLVLFVEEDTEGQQFSFKASDSEDDICVLDYNGNGTAGLELRYLYLPDGVRAYAETSLDKYVGEGGTRFLGDAAIRASGLRGAAVAAALDRLTYEAWIYSFSDVGYSEVGVEIVIYYQNPLQMNVLYEIIDTLELVAK